MKKGVIILISVLAVLFLNIGNVWAKSYWTPWSTTLSTPYWWWPNRGTSCDWESVSTNIDAYASETWTITCTPHNYYWPSYTWPRFLKWTSSTPNIVNCPDGDKSTGTYKTVASWWSTRRYLECQRWDDAAPTISDNYWYDGAWTNTASTITLTATEASTSSTNGTIASWIKNIKYCNTGANCLPNNTVSWTTYTHSAFWNGNHYLLYSSEDNAWNITEIEQININIDQTIPSAPTFSGSVSPSIPIESDVWSNNNTTSIITTQDDSWLVSPRTTYYCLDNSDSCIPKDMIPLDNTGPNTASLSEGIHYYRAQTCTAAWNCSSISTFIIKIDTTDPTPGEFAQFSLNINNGDYMKAIDSQTLEFTNTTITDPNISPIMVINSTLEKHDDNTDFISQSYERVDNFRIPGNNFSVVDSNTSFNDKDPWNYRPYSFNIWDVCDDAWNCSDMNQLNTFNVYANDIYKRWIWESNSWSMITSWQSC